jgi:hypothetical protein
MSDAQLFALEVTAAVLLAAYIFSIGYLITYLRRVHTETWVQLGRPAIQIPDPFNPLSMLRGLRTFLLTGWFMLVSNEPSKLNDVRVTKLIWSIRILLVVGFTLEAVVLKLSR